MCGILGVCATPGEVSSATFAAALAKLRFRGPDDSDTVCMAPTADREVLLGHRRLAILDLSSLGRQPMRSERTGSIIVFNGEIYNFKEIRTDLESLGCSFRSGSDTEVILAAYDVWGEASVGKLNGMFAFAILDVPKRRIFLARDRVGIKPLYYYTDGKRFAFASELLALTELRLAPSVMRSDAMMNFFAFGYVPGDMTPLENYAKLRAGFWLTYDLETHNLAFHQYWNVLDSYTQPKRRDDHELVDEFDALVYDAVVRQRVSDVPLGAFLSGGIDSSLVVAMMCKAARGRVETFTVGVEDQTDEAPAARALARHFGTYHHEEYISPDQLRDELPRIAAMYDEPFSDTSAIPSVAISRLMRRHVTVALSGDGGDELFHGYSRYQRTGMFARFHALPGVVRELLVGLLERVPSRRSKRYAYLLASSDLGAFHTRSLSWRNIVPFDNMAAGVLLWTDRIGAEVQQRLGARWPEDVPPAIDLLTYLPDDVLVKVDRASMASSLEVRVPLIDHRIVEFAATCPLTAKVRGATAKVLMKKVLARYAPPSLWDRPKRGFSVPIGRWFRNELRAWISDELLGSDWSWTAGVISRDGVEKLFARHMTGSLDLSLPLWALVSWKTWSRQVDRQA